MPQLRIAILTAGGTIDKDYSCDLGGYNFEVGEPAVAEPDARRAADLVGR